MSALPVDSGCIHKARQDQARLVVLIHAKTTTVSWPQLQCRGCSCSAMCVLERYTVGAKVQRENVGVYGTVFYFRDHMPIVSVVTVTSRPNVGVRAYIRYGMQIWKIEDRLRHM